MSENLKMEKYFMRKENLHEGGARFPKLFKKDQQLNTKPAFSTESKK